MTSTHHYDIIICGAGCAGLSLVMHLLQDTQLSSKKVLLVDHHRKEKNDRTWCFWETTPGLFEPIVYKHWKKLSFYAEGLSKHLDIGAYVYKLIRGIDFYNYCFEEIKKHPNVRFIEAPVEKLVSNEKETYASIGGERFFSNFIFSSILFEKPVLKTGHYWLLQHFKGWVIETETDHFDPSSATLMDFRTPQHNGATFFYVLPFTKTRALIEYTLFSKDLVSDEVYETALKNYIEKDLHIKAYTIHEREFGVIPMTNYPFPSRQGNIIYIGTAGGQTKASSGYTFQFIQKQSKAIVQGLKNRNDPTIYLKDAKRFYFYDSVLLQILQLNKMPGDKIFKRLFGRNKASQILKFLDNETTVVDEIPILKSLPVYLFAKAGLKEIIK